MKKEVVLKLQQKAQQAAAQFSNKDRQYNYNQETFTVDQIQPLSDNTAIVVMKKNTGKLAAFFFYYINGGGGIWNYFVVTYSHVFGMERVGKWLEMVEQHNYPLNNYVAPAAPPSPPGF
jgi:hypothetical protein